MEILQIHQDLLINKKKYNSLLVYYAKPWYKFLNWKKIDTKKEETLHATTKKTNGC